MNPISVIFVLVIFSGLQDYTAAVVTGNYDSSTALKIINCANAAYNEVEGCAGQDNFSDLRGEIDENDEIAKEKLNARIRLLLATGEMKDKFRNYMNIDVANVYPAVILSDR